MTNGSTTDFLDLPLNTSQQLRIRARVGNGAPAETALATTISTGVWYYLVARFISATNRRLSVYRADGFVEHAQNTTSTTPTGLSSEKHGQLATETNLFNGLIAERWTANADIQADGGQLNEDLLRQLAFRGPFSIPQLSGLLVDYRSFRRGLGSDQDSAGDFSPTRQRLRQEWSNNGALLAQHPPLLNTDTSFQAVMI